MNVTKLTTRYFFFTGKGGVGKTSISCATAIALAEKGRRVLLVSTDPERTTDFDHIIFDTAPTGHTILLLDAAEAYHREVLRQSSNMPETVRKLLLRLRDPDFTRILIVTLPEATPVHEAARLQSDLGRAEIRPFGWVINQSLALVATADSVLRSRQANEHGYIEEVCEKHSKRVALVPWMSEPLTGATGLRALVERREGTSVKSVDRLDA